MPSLQREVLDLPVEDLDEIVESVGSQWEGMRDKRVLLTGGTGFIGKWLLGSFLHANRKLKLGARITVLSRDPLAFLQKYPELETLDEVSWLSGDVREFELRGENQYELVIHAATDVVATQTPLQTLDTCIQGTRQVLDQVLSHGVQRMLLLSSGAVYGATPDGLGEIPESFAGAPDCLAPGSAYGEGKRISELLCAIAAKQSDKAIQIARCFAFVGPHLPLDKHFAIGNFIGAAREGATIEIKGDGTPLRSYLYASDMAAWLWTILFCGISCRAYNVGGDEHASIGELARRVVSVLGSGSAVHVAKDPVPGAYVQKYIPCLDRIKSELKVKVLHQLDDAIVRTSKWKGR